MTSPTFSVDREVRSGRFQRQRSRFRDPVEGPPERYHLYVARACPWSHRIMIARLLRGLEDRLAMSCADPYRDERGWRFSGDGYVDRANGWEYLSEAYERTDPDFAGRITVPALWDLEEERLVCNESGDLMRALNRWGDGPDLYPEQMRDEIDRVNDRVYEGLNNGVYRAGFARSQEAYDEAVADVFSTLGWLDDLLADRPWAAGDRITEADWRIFVTLVRFDEVYNLHFRCNRRRLVDFPRLWPYARRLHQQPGIAETVAMDEIKRHYYTTHDELNPKRIIPAGPAADWSEPA